jgi:hypothetical protein
MTKASGEDGRLAADYQFCSEWRKMSFNGHKYSIGEIVLFTSGAVGRPANGSYEVVRLLPPEGDDFQYRIKRAGESFERVAKESQLDHDA